MTSINLPPVNFELDVVLTPAVVTRMNFAVQNLMAAARFSRVVGTVEQDHAKEQFGDFFDEILHNAGACIFLCGASLEAYTNEIHADRQKLFSSDEVASVDAKWRKKERGQTLDKFDFFLEVRGIQSLSVSAAYGKVAALVKLRNALVHFKPEWSHEQGYHAALSQDLTGKFTPSPFLNDANIFPRRWASHSCTRWAIEACLEYATEFEQAVGFPDKYDRSLRARQLTP